MPTLIKFECPVCKLVVQGRNFRRHVKKEHKRDVPDHVMQTARSTAVNGVVRATW